jgi:uncharacterized Rossmann fold enzyme
MTILGWRKKYSDILKEFKYDEKKDKESAIILDSILEKSNTNEKIISLIKGKTVLVIGSGPSLSTAILNGIIPDIIVTDLDGDENTLEKIGKTKSIFVVHAHGDNIEKLELVKKFKNCIGTSQSTPFNKIQNFGGFTDGDRGVFLANHYEAKKIILFGMDFGKRIGKFSKTKKSERKVKLMKLKKGEFLLEWLSAITKSGI